MTIAPGSDGRAEEPPVEHGGESPCLMATRQGIEADYLYCLLD